MYLGNVKMYYDNDLNNIVRQDMMDIMTLEVGGITRPAQSLKEELIQAAEKIYREVPDLHIALSGGWDSNACLHTFAAAGLKPKVVIFNFPQGLNEFDVKPALDSCDRYGITPRVINIPEFAGFLAKNLIPTASKYQTYTFFQTLMAWYIEQLKINCLIVDKIDLRRDMNPSCQWSYIRSEVSGWADRFNLYNENKIYMNFYSYSAEAMLAYLKLPVIQQTMANSLSGKLSLQSLKHKIFKEGGYTDLPLFNRTVTTDRIIGVTSASEEAIKREIGFRYRVAYVGYDNFIRALETKGTEKWQYIL